MFRMWMTVLVVGVFSLAAVAEPEIEPEPELETSLELQGAWVRALPPVQPNTSAYLVLVNQGDTAVAVVGATADVANKVEIHRTREVDGLLRMEQLDGLAVAPGEEVALAPGGTHLMLFGLKYMPVPGDEVQLCLQLATGDEVCTVADVRKSADSQGHQHHH